MFDHKENIRFFFFLVGIFYSSLLYCTVTEVMMRITESVSTMRYVSAVISHFHVVRTAGGFDACYVCRVLHDKRDVHQTYRYARADYNYHAYCLIEDQTSPSRVTVIWFSISI